MIAQFLPCPGCSRHVKRGEPICPFCGAPASVEGSATRVLAGHLSRAALFAAGAVGVGIATTDCGNTTALAPYGAAPPYGGSPPIEIEEASAGVGPSAVMADAADGLGCHGEACGNPQSCALGGPGLTNCGDGGSGAESCCASLEVTGGTYYRTYDAPPPDDGGAFVDAADAGDGGPPAGSDPATVSTFRLDKYDVTVGRFREFVNAWAAGWFPEAGSGKHTHLNGGEGLANAGDDAGSAYEPGWVASDNNSVSPTNANLACPLNNGVPTWTALMANNENLPINCVNWYEAYAFCIWDGGFLPSEAEWQYAAAGGSEQREYPWGSAAPGTANQYAIYDCDYGSDGGGCPNPGVGSIANIAPVGTATLGAGLWGQMDLIGDVMVWTLDGWAPYVDPCTDCSNLGPISVSPGRVFRGAGFDYDAASLSPPEDRRFEDPTFRGYYIGFRCARAP